MGHFEGDYYVTELGRYKIKGLGIIGRAIECPICHREIKVKKPDYGYEFKDYGYFNDFCPHCGSRL